MTIAEERNVEVVQGYSQTDCSELLDQDAAGKSSSVTITLGTGILDEEAWSWIIFNNRKQTSTGIDLPDFIDAPVVAGAITAAPLTIDQQGVSVVILDSASPGNISLTQQASGTGVTPVTFEVNAGAVAVDPIHNGKIAVIYYRANQVNVEIIGGNTQFQPYQNIECYGKFCGTRFPPKRLWFPRVTSITGFNLDASSDTFTREFRAFLPPGWSQTYALFDA